MRPGFFIWLIVGVSTLFRADAVAGQSAVAAQSATDDPAAVSVPALAFAATADDSNFDKYFYFHRDDTDYPTALADIRECDGYARGLSYSATGAPGYSPYADTVAGAIGGAIGSVLADAIVGSAMRRQQRRVNMRACMGFKEYKAYGLPKSIWTEFHFEEGNATVPEPKRQVFLRRQAKVASGMRPATQEITQWTR